MKIFIKENLDVVCIASIIILFALPLIVFVPHVINNLHRQNSLVSKAGVVVVHDNAVFKKIDIRTISYCGSGYYICRIDYGSGVTPRFGEAKFHESEIEFLPTVEGK